MIEAMVSIVFTEPLLGTVPKSNDVYAKYIEAKRTERAEGGADPGGPETETVIEDLEASGWTGFHEDTGGLILYDYAVKGFLKEAANVLKDELSEKNLRSKIDNLWFVFPRKIPILNSDGSWLRKPHGVLERPLRAMTMQGPRVTLMRSDRVDAGSKLQFTVKMISSPAIKRPEEVLESALNYGSLKGMGQWRNGSFGRLVVSAIDFAK